LDIMTLTTTAGLFDKYDPLGDHSLGAARFWMTEGLTRSESLTKERE